MPQVVVALLVGGWAYPSEKYERQLGCFFPIYGKIKFMFQTTNQSSSEFFFLFHHQPWAPLESPSACVHELCGTSSPSGSYNAVVSVVILTCVHYFWSLQIKVHIAEAANNCLDGAPQLCILEHAPHIHLLGASQKSHWSSRWSCNVFLGLQRHTQAWTRICCIRAKCIWSCNACPPE